MKQLTVRELEFLCLGSAVLGSGGGGDPYYFFLMAKHQIERYGPITILSQEELQEEDVVVPVGMIGAPVVNMEQLVNGREIEDILREVEKYIGTAPTVLMAGEIGGSNAFVPLLVAGKLGLPVLDGDLLGRAFPELQMNSCSLQGKSPAPAFVADSLGNTVIIQTSCVQKLEQLARALSISMGSSAAIALHLLKGNEVRGNIISGTLSLALKIGEAIYKAREKGESPIVALKEEAKARLLAQGTLVGVRQEILGGFLSGSVSLSTKEGEITLLYQNEYLLAFDKEGPLASTPDILVLIEEISGTPITSEKLKYGLQVALMVIPAPEIWKTKKGLALVGPRVFGFDVDYE